MFQLCYSLLTLSFKCRSILNENSVLLKWKWETFYLENVKLNRLIFFIIKMSKWMLLLFSFFPYFFQQKVLIQVQKQLVPLIHALLFSRFERGTRQSLRAQEPHSWGHPWLMGGCPWAHVQSVRSKPLWPSGLVWKKAMRRGNTTRLLLSYLFLFAKPSASGRNIKIPTLTLTPELLKQLCFG